MDTPRNKNSRLPLGARTGCVLALFSLCLFGVATPSIAEPTQDPVVLGVDGTITRLLAGAYGELFAGETEAKADDPVLALEQVLPDGTTERWMIPGTEDRDQEEIASLVLDDGTGAVFLLWETTINSLHPLLRLARFEAGEFSSILDITSGAFSDKGTAQVIITRDMQSAETEAGSTTIERTLVHVVWWQEAPGGSLKLYAPVVIEKGELQQQPTILDLGRFSPPDTGVEPSLVFAPEPLANLLSIRRGETNQTVAIGFLEPHSQRIRTLRMDLLSRTLTELGDKLPAEIVIIGMRAGGLPNMAKSVAPLLETIPELHESMRLYMGTQLEEVILGWEGGLDEEGLEGLTRKLGDEILGLGSRVAAGGLTGADSELVDALDGREGLRHVLSVSFLSDRPAPEIGTPEGAVRFFLSESGLHAIIAWQEAGEIHFRESLEIPSEAGSLWSEVGHLAITEELDSTSIFEMLERRISDR